MQSISRWEAEELSKSEADEDKSSATCRTHPLFAESQGGTPAVTEEDLVNEMDSTPEPSGQEGHYVSTTASKQMSCDSDWTHEKSTGKHGKEKVPAGSRTRFG